MAMTDILVQAGPDGGFSGFLAALDLYCRQWLGKILSQTFLGGWHATGIPWSCPQLHKFRAVLYQGGK